MDNFLKLRSLVGVFSILFLAYLFSKRRGEVKYRAVLSGLGLQFTIAVVVLKIEFVQSILFYLSKGIANIERATQEGTAFVFGYLGKKGLDLALPAGESSFIFAFQALPVILVVSALSSLFFYWGILPRVIGGIGKFFSKTMGIGGALALGSAANIFLGIEGAPFMIKPHLKKMRASEIFALMSVGMATVSGTVMVLYASFLSQVVDNVLGHIIAAVTINVPGALVLSRIIYPDDEFTSANLERNEDIKGSMDAIAKGTADGLMVLLNVVAMLIVALALVSLVNSVLGLVPFDVGGEALSLQMLFGYVFAPLMWLMGIPWSECYLAGVMMGTKIVLNEIVAYTHLAGLSVGEFSPRSSLVMLYALCGFANFGSVGITLGAYNAMVPERRGELSKLGMLSLLAGGLATILSGCVVSLLL